MRTTAAFAYALGAVAVAASPYQPRLISERAIGPGDVTYDTPDGCPRTLEPGQFESPYLVQRISQQRPQQVYEPSQHAEFTPNDIATAFAFRVPGSRADSNCTLEFIFPRRPDVHFHPRLNETEGTFWFHGYNPGNSSCIDSKKFSWSNQPADGLLPSFPPIKMSPGHAYTIDVGPCRYSAGTCATGMTWTNDTTLHFNQDNGTARACHKPTCPIGVYTSYV